jgi:hypothetical protein
MSTASSTGRHSWLPRYRNLNESVILTEAKDLLSRRWFGRPMLPVLYYDVSQTFERRLRPRSFLATIRAGVPNRRQSRRQHGANSLHQQDQTTAKKQQPQGPLRGHHGGLAPTRSSRKKVAGDRAAARIGRHGQAKTPYADCRLGDFVNTISNTSSPAPTTIALSATLKAGHWYWPI